MTEKKRVTFYIDGFNFYFGLKRTCLKDKKWLKYYWINVVKLCESFLSPDQELKKVIYFTASPLNPQKSSRQSAFLNANKLLNAESFEIVRGKYLEKHIICPYCKVDISRPEEKKTDVNISIRMIEDCVMQKTDTIILVSADTDLIPPLELIKKNFPKVGIKVYFPPSNYSNEIQKTLHNWKTKPVLMEKNSLRFEKAIMQDEVSVNDKKYTIPAEWKQKQKNAEN